MGGIYVDGEGVNGHYYSEEMGYGEPCYFPRPNRDRLRYHRRLTFTAKTRETDRGILFRDHNGNDFWVPKTLIRKDRDGETLLVWVGFRKTILPRENP
jgi:hypothetical protein